MSMCISIVEMHCKVESSEVAEVDQDEPIDVEVVAYSSFFFDADDDLVLFSDVEQTRT